MPERRLSRAIAAVSVLVLLAACGETGPGGQAADDMPAAVPYNGAATAPPREEDPEKLLGLDAAALQDLLGDPTLVRRDGDAEVWQYRASACVLDLFIYGDDKRVEHVELRDREGGAADGIRACFAAMLNGDIPTS